jgi:hypothetical protein
VATALSGLVGNYLAGQWNWWVAGVFGASLFVLWRLAGPAESGPPWRRLILGISVAVAAAVPGVPVPLGGTGIVLISDDFSTDTGWATAVGAGSKPGGSPQIDGVLRLPARPGENIAVFSAKLVGEHPGDMITEVDLTRISGHGEYGAVCRVQPNTGYEFLIRDDGRAGIFKIVNGWPQDLPGWRHTAALHPSGPDHLAMTCQTVGTTVRLELKINGTSVVSATDQAGPHLAGTLALVAHPIGPDGLTVEVDNLVIRQP